VPDLIDWFPVRNRSGEVIPSCGLVLVTGMDADTDDVAEVDQPDTDDDPRVAVLGRGVVLDDGYGEATFDNRVVVAYDEADGTPASGEEWGVKAGNWKLRSGYKGFTIIGGASGGLVHAARRPIAAAVTSAQVDLSSDFTLTAAAGTFQDTALDLSIPSAGTFLLWGHITAKGNVTTFASTAPGEIAVQLYDDTATAYIAGTRCHVLTVQVTGRDVRQTASFLHRVTFAGSRTLSLFTYRDNVTTWATSYLQGYDSKVGWLKL
jgi:hypothetical protein